MSQGYGAPVERATRDVDFAVCVKNWEQYQEIRQHLFTDGYVEHRHQQQRLIKANGYVIDIIPFGPISVEGHIAWPPDWDIVLSVIGFEDAFSTSTLVHIENTDISIEVANPAGIALLKLISWQEREPGIRRKDAQDLAYLCRHYSRFDSVSDSLYTNGVMEQFDWDEEIASSFALGAAVAQNTSAQAMDTILQLFNKDFQHGGFERLISESIEGIATPSERRKHKILEAFKQGFLTQC